jgi:hypothetical protein
VRRSVARRNILTNCRRAQAINYLESIPLTFLTQVHNSLEILNYREREIWIKSKSKKRTNGKRKKREENNEESEEEYYRQTKKDVVPKGDVGVALRLKNRSTGSATFSLVMAS